MPDYYYFKTNEIFGTDMQCFFNLKSVNLIPHKYNELLCDQNVFNNKL